MARLEDNLRFLATQTGIHVHADLIVGLPGEDLASFGRGFDRLHALGSAEIQVGILKRLRGAPIARHTVEHGMVYAQDPPYEVLQTSVLSFGDVQRMKRFARYFDLVSNNGKLPALARLLLSSSSSAFLAFLTFADWMWATTRSTHGIALPRLATLVSQHLVESGVDEAVVHAALLSDFGREKLPTQLVAGIPKRQRAHLTAR